MHMLLVIIHVVSMIASIGLMTGAVGVGLAGHAVAARLATNGFLTAIVGFASGGLLLIDSVLSLECGLLALYLIGVTVLYHVGFAFGDASRARLIRQAD